MKHHRLLSKVAMPILASAFLLTLALGMFSDLSASENPDQPIVQELKELLKARPDLQKALETSLKKADRLNLQKLDQYYAFLNNMITAIPDDRDWLPLRLDFFYAISQSPNGLLNKDPAFRQWVHNFVTALGRFLNTTESAKHLETFFTDPAYHIEDYIMPPGGWLTFNQFFTRHVKPGRRPVAGPCDDSVIVSPSDSVYEGQWPIDEKANVVAKGAKWSVLQLLEGSPYRDRFNGGIFIHSYLSPRDYHRFHVPVKGKVLESRTVMGEVVLNVFKKDDGELAVSNELGYQFSQERGILILDSPVGLVAVIPVGMGIVSSVNLTAEVGAELAKGEEFGYFAFGASDIVVLFEKDAVKLTAQPGKHYKQGEAIAVGKHP